MGICGTMYSYKSQDLILVHLDSLAGRKIICNNDHRLIKFHIPAVSAIEISHQTLGNILYICRTGFHIIIIHAGKHLGKVISCSSHCIFSVYLLGADDIFNRFRIILIIQHHLMDFKDRCTGFAYFFYGFIVKLLKLFPCFFLCLGNPCDLCLRIFHFYTFYYIIILFQNRNLSQGNSFIN